MRRRGELMERFVNYIEVSETGCWEWTGHLKKGYGSIVLGTEPGVGRTLYAAHRFSYLIYKGEVGEGLELDHLCRNRKCVNPDHLEPVTHQINTLRGISPAAFSAQMDYCKNGHEFTGRNNRGDRICHKCQAARQKQSRTRKLVGAAQSEGRVT